MAGHGVAGEPVARRRAPLFEKPKGNPDVVRQIVDAYRSFNPTPPFNYVVETGATGLPHFRETTSYDPCYHIQHIALPDGATYDDLLRLVADLHEPMLDRCRPLFRDWIIDNVPGNRFAVYAKVHHAIIDGVSGTKRLYASLSPSPKRVIPMPAFAALVPVHKPRPPKAIVDRLAEIGISATKQTLALRDVSVGALKKGLASLFGADPVGSAPFSGAARADERAAADGTVDRDAVAAARRNARGRRALRRDAQ